jgi:hypothetical protein
MADKRKSTQPNKSVSIGGDVVDSVVVAGDHNTVSQTIIQKFFNIFKSDAETLEQRNRRILLGHVENAWIKGVLDASLHGAALLDLGIKQDPDAVTKYPWAIKKESTDETLPAGTSMLEIFDSIGMGRSLLILGAPGSGKTTMLLELARGLIARAREDVTQPIPMVFNLASWTEKLTLADWLAQELNNLYSVPRKTAPDWVKGNKLLLLLDGLDEVRQDSRAKCVEAINAFRKEHGLTSLAVCSRSQDYADLNAKLSFEGAIEVQPLTQKQITEFVNRFGKEMAGIKQVLKKDNALREMAETPLFLSIMIMAYRNKQDMDIFVSKDEKSQRKNLFDTYIEHMFERPHTQKMAFKKPDVSHWLSYLASKMVEHNQVPYVLENMQVKWLNGVRQIQWFNLISRLIVGIMYGLIFGLMYGLLHGHTGGLVSGLIFGLMYGLMGGLIFGLMYGLVSGQTGEIMGEWVGRQIGIHNEITTVDSIFWRWNQTRNTLMRGMAIGLTSGVMAGLIIWLIDGLVDGVIFGLGFGLMLWLGSVLISGLNAKQIKQVTYPRQRLVFSAKNFLFTSLLSGLISGLLGWLLVWLMNGLISGSGLMGGLSVGPLVGLSVGLLFGGLTLIKHYTLRFILSRNNLLPWRLVPFLDHCVDLIFLRRVGGGYIFVHRLLMEHFAEMYVEALK